MNIEKQVVSLELAKQLKDAGYPQEGLWWWTNRMGRFRIVSDVPHTQYVTDIYYAAPTVAELGEKIKGVCFSWYGTYVKDNECWYVFWAEDTQSFRDKQWITDADTEANARAKMLLYLHKEGLIKW